MIDIDLEISKRRLLGQKEFKFPNSNYTILINDISNPRIYFYNLDYKCNFYIFLDDYKRLPRVRGINSSKGIVYICDDDLNITDLYLSSRLLGFYNDDKFLYAFDIDDYDDGYTFIMIWVFDRKTSKNVFILNAIDSYHRMYCDEKGNIIRVEVIDDKY